MDTTNLIKDEKGLIKTGEFTSVNPQFMSQQGLQQAQGFAGVPITSETLSGATSINLPTPTPLSTTGVAITARNLSSAEQAKASLDAEEQAYREQAKLTAESSKGKLADLFANQQKAYEEKIAGYQTEEFKALKELKTKALNDQIALRKAQDAEIEAINKQSMLTDVQRNQKMSEISQRYAFQSAQLSLTSSIASNNFENAKSAIDDMYTLTMEKYTPLINYYSQLAQNDQNIFNKAELQILENKRDEIKTLQTQQADFEKTKGTMMIQAKTNGADNATIQAMSRATDMSSLIQAAGQYAGQIVVPQKTTTVSTYNLAGLTPEQQADPFIQKMLASAGGKPMTDTFAQSLNKGLNVLSQIGGLQTNIKDTNTGPLAGLFRGANPWDTNAQTIKAQLNAIVPNLARGVYGEVGVLTDNDIKTYSQTLPNLKSTEDIRNAVLGITVDLIGKSIKRTLEVNAANGKDVSGFVDIYLEMNNTKDSIFSQIPGYKGATKSLQEQGITKVEENIFDEVVGIPSSSGGGFFSNIWKGLTGQ